MDFLKAQLADLSKGAPKKKGYQNRGELERQREEKYLAEQKAREEERQRKAERAHSDQKGDASEAKEDSKPPIAGQKRDREDNVKESLAKSPQKDVANSRIYAMPVEDVKRRLRLRNAPVTLFGETERERIDRLRALEKEEDKRGAGAGGRNEYMAAMGQTESSILAQLAKQGTSSTPVVEHLDDASIKKAAKRAKEAQVDVSQLSESLLQNDKPLLHQLLHAYLRKLLQDWEDDLEHRSSEEKQSKAGKQASAIQKQSAEYLKPLFRGLKREQIEEDVLPGVTEICCALLERDYLKANDAYLRLSIGNAPWPIGVTMVGIHERSAREKIFSSQVAHVLNDEAQRKWVQSLKRLMTFAETKYPPTKAHQGFAGNVIKK